MDANVKNFVYEVNEPREEKCVEGRPNNNKTITEGQIQSRKRRYQNGGEANSRSNEPKSDKRLTLLRKEEQDKSSNRQQNEKIEVISKNAEGKRSGQDRIRNDDRSQQKAVNEPSAKNGKQTAWQIKAEITIQRNVNRRLLLSPDGRPGRRREEHVLGDHRVNGRKRSLSKKTSEA